MNFEEKNVSLNFVSFLEFLQERNPSCWFSMDISYRDICICYCVSLQEEYLDALNKEEIAKRELDGVQNQLAAVKADIERMQGEKETLARLYEEYDKLLSE